MNVRSARGLEMLAVILVGFVTGPFLGAIGLAMLEMDGDTKIPRFILSFMTGGGAAGMWLFARLYGNTEVLTHFDPVTRQRVRVTATHSLFSLSPVSLAMVLSVLCGLSVIFAFSLPVDASQMPSGTASVQGRAAFQEANERLTGVSRGKAHGNTPEAEKLAEAFSNALQQVRKAGIEKSGRSSAFSLTKGDFLTYCLLTERSCIFMVHVPELKNFAEDAKVLIADSGWIIAAKLMQATNRRPGTMVVGMRGAMLYDRVIIGKGGTQEKSRPLAERILHGNRECRTELAVQFDVALKPD